MNLGAQKVKAWRYGQQPKAGQVALCERFGLSVIAWSRIERGERTPPLEQAVKLAQAGVCDESDWYKPPLAMSLDEFNCNLRQNPLFHSQLLVNAYPCAGDNKQGNFEVTG